MADHSLTFALDGDVSLDDLHEAITNLRALVRALSSEVASKETIDWSVADLSGGSASATLSGVSDAPDAVVRVITAYGAVGTALEQRRPIPYSDRVNRAAQSLAGLVHGSIHAARFETASETAIVTDPALADVPKHPVSALGTVEGRVQTLTSRDRLRFTLYDTIHDKAVACYVAEEQQDLLRGIWDRRAVVHGWVTRDPISGRPLTVRRVSAIEAPRDVQRGSYIHARGVVTPLPGAPAPEVTVRRMRDAQ